MMANPTTSSSSVLSSSPSSSLTTATASSLKENALLGIIGTAFLSVLGLTFPFITMQLRSPLPYMGTPIRKVDKALRFILARHYQNQRQQNAMNIEQQKTLSTSNVSFTTSSNNNTHNNTIQPPRYVDLGSGDGSSVIHAAKIGYIATGIELNTTLFLLSLLRQRYHQFSNFTSTIASATTTTNTVMTNNTSQQQRTTKFIYGNMFQTNSIIQKSIQNADVIMIFGVPSLMTRIASLLNKNCKVGCYIMSYRFRIPLLSSPSSSLAPLTAAKGVVTDNAIVSSSNEMTKTKEEEEDDSTITAAATATTKDDDVNIIVDRDVVDGRMNGSSNTGSSSSSVVDAILIYDDEEMRVYEIQKSSVEKK